MMILGRFIFFFSNAGMLYQRFGDGGWICVLCGALDARLERYTFEGEKFSNHQNQSYFRVILTVIFEINLIFNR